MARIAARVSGQGWGARARAKVEARVGARAKVEARVGVGARVGARARVGAS